MSVFCGSRWPDIFTLKECAIVTGGLSAGFLSYFTVKAVSGYVLDSYKAKKVTRARLARKAELLAQLQEWKSTSFSRISKDRAEAITGLGFTDLQSQLQNDRLKPTEVLYAYQYKAAVENERLNFVTEDVLEAEAYAQSLDALEGRKPFLYGIPFSLKENFALAGYDATNGVSTLLNRPEKDDCAFVKIMKHHGAIPFIRTNLSQTTMSHACHNPLFGDSLNPHDTSRSPGGSSGGEGAAIASGGSILGFGGDLGGSIRIPSSWNGICGLKPCRQRISKLGFTQLAAGQHIVHFVPGPMGRDIDSLVECSKALFSEFALELDRTVVPLTFRNEIYWSKRPLRIGFYFEMEGMTPTASSKRAVRMAKDILEKNGHTLVPWSIPDSMKAIGTICMRAYYGDGGKSWDKFVGPDEISHIFPGKRKSRFLSQRIRSSIKGALIVLLKLFIPAKWMDSISPPPTSVYDWWELTVAADNYRDKVLGEWRELKLDAVLCPAMPWPAFKIGYYPEPFGPIFYTNIWNLLNFPAGAVPVTKVNMDDLKQPYPTNDRSHRRVSENLVGSEGLPMNAQCVAGPCDEEIVLRLMKEIETGLLERS